MCVCGGGGGYFFIASHLHPYISSYIQMRQALTTRLKDAPMLPRRREGTGVPGVVEDEDVVRERTRINRLVQNGQQE